MPDKYYKICDKKRAELEESSKAKKQELIDLAKLEKLKRKDANAYEEELQKRGDVLDNSIFMFSNEGKPIRLR